MDYSEAAADKCGCLFYLVKKDPTLNFKAGSVYRIGVVSYMVKFILFI